MEVCHKWGLLKNYFDKYNYTQHQISSYNTFVTRGIQDIIHNEANITIQTDSINYEVEFGQVFVSKPKTIEEDRITKKLFPSKARQRDLTYDSTIFIDIKETVIDSKTGKVEEVIEHKRVNICKIPVMVYSQLCNLNTHSKQERINKGECEYDKGGYFIVKGKERAIVGQIRNVYNQVMVIKQKNTEKYKFISEIRSMSEETGHSTLIQLKISNDDRKIDFTIPYINKQIPAGIILKALGYTTDKEIKQLINLDSEITEKYINYILRDSFFIQSKDEALEYIGRFSIHMIKDIKQIDYAQQVVYTELFPHLGITSTTKEKAYFVGTMINKLISTNVGIRSDDDRDNYSTKRVEVAGILFHELFRTLFKRYIKTLVSQLEKKKQRPDIINLISRNNIITLGFHHCCATGNWGVQKNNYIRTGVSQVLSRLTYGASISHLRRIVIPIGKEAKNAKIRQIHPSQIFYICPAESPEGQSVGIVMNLSLLTQVSTKLPTILVRTIIEKAENLISIDEYSGDNDIVKVYLNGIIIGVTEDEDDLLSELREFRHNKLLKITVSISFNEINNEIRIFCDEGRLIRPVLRMSGNEIIINNPEYRNMDWDTLVEKNVIQYFDNSEIENYVIAMNKKDIEKHHCDFCEICPSMMLGIMGSIIPYPDHSQSPRNAYQSSMGKQAIGIHALSHNIRVDTITHVLDYPQKPLVSTIPSRLIGFDDMPSGINAIVAIACYSGFNQEDSVILNKSAVERGLFSATSYRTYTEQETKRGTYNYEKICIPPVNKRKSDSNYSLLDENGIVRKRINNENIYVKCGDVIVGKILVNSDKNGNQEILDVSLKLKSDEEGYVDRIIKTITPNGYQLIKIVLRQRKIPEVGDKVASKAAQKGTIGAILPQEDMPFSPTTGICPDIIINSHCIPSRMTINQLMECVLGKSCVMEGKIGDATPFQDYNNNAQEICDKLKKHGFEENGYETMFNGMTGEELEAKYLWDQHIIND